MQRKKTPPYTEYVNAVNELSSISDSIVTMAFAENWLTNYKLLYEQYMFSDSCGIEAQFYELYKYFDKMANCYKLRPACEIALEQYHSIRKENRRIKGNEKLKHWTAKYDQIGLSEYLYHYRFCVDPENEKRIICDLCYCYGTYFISFEEFKSIIEFQKVFGHLFWTKKVVPDRLAKFNEEEDARYAEARAQEELLDDMDNATPIETRSIAEIEKDLIGLVPATADIGWQCTGIYDDLKRGHEYFHQHEFDKAIEHYKAAAARQFNDVLFFCLALSYYLNGDYNNAIAAANPYNGKQIELPTFSRGWNAFILDTTPIDDLNYLLEKRLLKIAS